MVAANCVRCVMEQETKENEQNVIFCAAEEHDLDPRKSVVGLPRFQGGIGSGKWNRCNLDGADNVGDSLRNEVGHMLEVLAELVREAYTHNPHHHHWHNATSRTREEGLA